MMARGRSAVKLSPIQIRKCRECGKESKLAFDASKCPACGASYGPLAVGLDREGTASQEWAEKGGKS